MDPGREKNRGRTLKAGGSDIALSGPHGSPDVADISLAGNRARKETSWMGQSFSGTSPKGFSGHEGSWNLPKGDPLDGYVLAHFAFMHHGQSFLSACCPLRRSLVVFG